MENVKSVESSAVKVDERGVSLPNRPARFVMMSNWNVENNSNFTYKSGTESAGSRAVTEAAYGGAGAEVLWGFRGTYAHQLFAGQTTILIPITNLEDICLRTRPGQSVTIWYSFFE